MRIVSLRSAATTVFAALATTAICAGTASAATGGYGYEPQDFHHFGVEADQAYIHAFTGPGMLSFSVGNGDTYASVGGFATSDYLVAGANLSTDNPFTGLSDFHILEAGIINGQPFALHDVLSFPKVSYALEDGESEVYVAE